MLTLTRKVGEHVNIDDDVLVVVKEIRRNHVRLRFHAPKSVRIYRGEIYAKIKAELRSELERREAGPRTMAVVERSLDNVEQRLRREQAVDPCATGTRCRVISRPDR